MRQVKMWLFISVAALCAGRTAYADRYYHRGWHPHGGYHNYYRGPGVGFYFGWPWYPRPYYPYPYYSYPYYPYYPPVVTVPSNPPVYIERDQPQTSQQFPPGYWYYCENPPGYYPYVKECPQGWRQVDPTPER